MKQGYQLIHNYSHQILPKAVTNTGIPNLMIYKHRGDVVCHHQCCVFCQTDTPMLSLIRSEALYFLTGYAAFILGNKLFFTRILQQMSEELITVFSCMENKLGRIFMIRFNHSHLTVDGLKIGIAVFSTLCYKTGIHL